MGGWLEEEEERGSCNRVEEIMKGRDRGRGGVRKSIEKNNQYEKRGKIIQKSKQRHTQRMRVRERKQPTNSAAGIAIGRAPVF